MQVYLVGGAVRDKLLGINIKERDWVVVGATVTEMLVAGFFPVGKDFPVFLHPKTKDEYALARTERKVAKGYKGFNFYVDKSITLEQDLVRRDLTINAMAEGTDGAIIDPFGGQEDLENGVLRHVSSAFAEDPVRILRVARFAARFGNFTVHNDTIQLMHAMVKNGEVDALVPERVWQELKRALNEKYPERFFAVLNECGALEKIFPEIFALFGVPNPKEYHPEIDTGVHTMLAIQEAVKLNANDKVLFATLLHDVGKTQTAKENWPKHYRHAKKGVPVIKKLCKRLKIPNEYADLAVLVARYHHHCHNAFKLKACTILKLFQALDAFRRPQRFNDFLSSCKADALGTKKNRIHAYCKDKFFQEIYFYIINLEIKDLTEKFSGEKIKVAIYERRVSQIVKFLAQHKNEFIRQ